MSNSKLQQSENFTTTTGHDLSESGWLDNHFATAQPEYEAILRSAKIQRGWRVLDAGCGSGSFIPLMSELVGKDGHITALDTASENIDIVNKRISEYEEKTMPLIEFYKKEGILSEIDATQDIDGVASQCIEVLEKLSKGKHD